MAALLGLEVSGVDAILTVVDRQGHLLCALRERLSAPAAQWWTTHPEERFRAITSLLDTALREGLLAGGVAAIGVCATPGLVLLGPEFEVIAPRDLPWSEALDGCDADDLGRVLAQLAGHAPSAVAKVGAVLSTLDFIRFRLTGALGTHASFAWRTGLTHLPPRATTWNTEEILGLGFRTEAFVPIFDATARVGVIHPDVAARCGIPMGVWVHAGAEPVAANLALNADSGLGGPPIVLLNEGRWEAWESCPTPVERNPRVITADGHEWWQRLSVADLDPSEGRVPAQWGDYLLDLAHVAAPSANRSQSGRPLGEWPSTLPGSPRVAAGAGQASIAPAVQAGLGIGWWRDSRVLRRKYLRPLPYEEWRARVQPVIGHAAVQAEPDD
ncbi:MAG: FGGY family carbohydrate kinase [Planctomycetota bacterium]